MEEDTPIKPLKRDQIADKWKANSKLGGKWKLEEKQTALRLSEGAEESHPSAVIKADRHSTET